MEPPWVTPYRSWAYWRRNWRNLGRSFLESLGAIWLLARVASQFRPEASEWTPWWIMASVPTLWAVWECRPVGFVKHRLKDRDVWIEIRIGDIFKVEGSLVISTNSTFDTSIAAGLISPNSLQGQFTRMYYDDESHLDRDLETALENEVFEIIDGNRRGKNRRYGMGTVAKIQPRRRTAYMVAIADMNEHGVAAGSLDGVVESLGKLWHYIGERGEMEAVAIPVLGTGRARIQTEREEMIREIIGSFIAACSEKKFCEKLTIAIATNDQVEHEIDLQELGNYLRYACRYTSLKGEGDIGGGQAVQ